MLRQLGDLEESLLERLFRQRHGPESTWLRSHPATDEHIRDLLALEAPSDPLEPGLSEPGLAAVAGRLPPLRRTHPWYVR